MSDPLEELERQGREERRAAVQEKYHSPEAKAKKKAGRANVRRGYRCEKWWEKVLIPFGFKRNPLSGRLGGNLSCDLQRDGPTAWHTIEVKQVKGGAKFLRKTLKQNNADVGLIDPADYERDEAVVFMWWSTFVRGLAEMGWPKKVDFVGTGCIFYENIHSCNAHSIDYYRTVSLPKSLEEIPLDNMFGIHMTLGMNYLGRILHARKVSIWWEFTTWKGELNER